MARRQGGSKPSRGGSGHTPGGRGGRGSQRSQGYQGKRQQDALHFAAGQIAKPPGGEVFRLDH